MFFLIIATVVLSLVAGSQERTDQPWQLDVAAGLHSFYAPVQHLQWKRPELMTMVGWGKPLGAKQSFEVTLQLGYARNNYQGDALFLQLLYVRQKNFYYVAHAIFTIHLYIFVFIVMLIEIGISQLTHVHGLAWLNYINNLLTIAILFYLYKAMRNFYEQQRFKTILKYILFLLSFFILIILLFMIFALVSAFQI